MNRNQVPLQAIRRAAGEKDMLLRALRHMQREPRPRTAAKLCAAALCLCMVLLAPLHGAAMALLAV